MTAAEQSVFTIIIYTQIQNKSDFLRIPQLLKGFDGLSEWSHDEEDADQVLRLVASTDISERLLSKLTNHGIRAAVKEVFDKAPEMEINPNKGLLPLLARVY